MASDGDVSVRVSGRTSAQSGVEGKPPAQPESVCQGIVAQIVDAVPHPVFWKDCQSVYLGCNEEFARAVGLGSAAEIVGKTDFDLPWPRAEAEAYRADDRAVIETGRIRRHIVEPLQQADGSRLWIDTTKLPLRTPEGQICGVVGFYEDITEHKQAEETARQERHFSEAAIQAMPGAFFMFDESGRLVKWNRNVETLTGYTAEEIAGRTLFDLLRPDCREQVAQRMQEAFSTGSAVAEVVLVSKDGKETHYYCHGLRTVRDGQPYVIGVGIDVSERIRAEAELERTRLLLEAVVEQSPVPMAMAHAPERRIGFANRAAREFLGKTDEPDYTDMPLAETYEMQSWCDVLPDGASTPPEERPLARTLRGERFTNATYGVIRKDGTLRWASVNGTPIRGHDGELVAGLIVFQDITERKAADEALRESEERFRRVAELTGQLLYGWDFASGAVHWSGRLQEITGHAPEEMNARGLAGWQECVHPEDVGHAMAELDVAIRDRRTRHCEYRFRKADGTYMHVSDEGACLYDDAGRAQRMLGVIKDVTERKQAEIRVQGLNRLREELLGEGDLNAKLRRVTDGVVEIFDSDFARIWLSAPGDRCAAGCPHAGCGEGPHVCRRRDRCLHLVASSGRYTHLDGSMHRRVPFGCYKIGRIASGDEPSFLTNAVTEDPRVHNHEWARDLGLVSFAGYRLLSAGQEPIGVLALFSRHPLSPEEETLLASVAGTTSQVILAAQANEALRESEQRYRSFVANTTEGIYRIDFTEPVPIDLPPEEVIARIDRHAILSEVNEALAGMYGLRAADMIGRPAKDFAPDCGRRAALLLQRENYQVSDEQTVDHDKDGRPIYLSESGIGLVEDGRLIRIWGVQRDISERKRAEEKLRESETKYRALFDAAGDAIFLLDADSAPGRVVECNRRAEDMFGVTREQLRQLAILDFTPPEQADGSPSQPAVAARIAQALRGETQHFEWRHSRPDGTIFDTDVTLTRVSLGTGPALLAVVRDVTGRKRAEDELRESERKYRDLSSEFQSILGAIPGSLVLLSPDLKIVWANEYTKNTSMGFESEEMLGQYCYRCRHDLSEPCEACPVRRCFASGKPEFGERDTPNGKIWELHAAPVFGDQGEISGVIEIAFEVTEYRRAERALKDSESRLRGLIQAAPIGIIFVKDRTTVSVNEFLCDLLGYSQAEFAGKSSRHVYFTQEEFEDVGRKLYGPASDGGHTHVEARLRRKDGTAVDVILSGAALRPDEPDAGFVVTVQDITQRRRAEEELKQLAAVVRHSSELVNLSTFDGRMVFLNDAGGRMLGIDPDTVGQHTILDVIPEDWRARVEDAILPALMAGRTWEGELQYRNLQSGRLTDVHATTFTIGDPVTGRPAYLVNVSRDITERKRADSELLREKQFTEKLLESMPGIFFLYDSTCHLKRWNKAHETVMGFTADELRDWYIPDWHETPEDAAIGMALVSKVLETGVGGSFETTLINKQGRFVPYLISITRLMTPDGPFMMGVGIDITERKQIEEERKRLTAILDSTSDVVVMNDPAGGLFYLNAAGRRVLGWDEEAALDSHDLSELYPAWAHNVLEDEALPAVHQTGFWQGETAILGAGGREIPVSQLLMAHRAADGHIEHYSSIMRDITERKRAEQVLQSRLVAMMRPLDDTTTLTFSDLFDLEEIQKLQDAFTESSGTAQMITDPEGNPITRPSGFCRLCAEFIRQSEKGRQRCYLSDSSLGRVSIDGPTVRPCLSAGLWGAGASIMVGGKHVANWLIGQVRNERLDLDQIARYAEEIDVDPVEFRKALLEVPVMSEEQFRRVAHTLFVLSRELSTKAYQNVQQARFIADLKRMEEERDRLFNLSLDMLCIAGFDGHFKQVNPAWTRALGWSAAELTDPAFLDLVHPDDVPATVAAVERLRQGREVRSFENRYRCKDGTYRWLSWNSYPLMEQELIFAVCRDVTELKAGEEEHARLERQLRQSQKMEAVGQLAGGVAHDFNNILTAILGNVDLLQQTLAHTLAADEAPMVGLREVERGALRAADLTRQLLLFSRRGVAQPEPLELNQTLNDAVKLMHRLLTENVRLDLRLAPDLPPVWADGGQMEQVIVNLVVNARDAMPDGGRIVIETSNEMLDEAYADAHADAHPGPHVLLAVSDTGEGMSRATMERIFEPFFTTKPVGKGTGLGLATVYGIVTQAGGHITVYSEVGRGSTFRVYLPALPTPVTEAPDPAPAAESPAGGAETILVCEDDDAVRQLVAHMLRREGYTVVTAADGEDALRRSAAFDGTIHLLISDVIMPDINGRRLTETLLEQRPDLRTLYMSGYTADIIAHHGVLDDNVEFLAKPFSRRALLRRVREVLDGVRTDTPPE